MTYARIENGVIVEYPVYEGMIRERFLDPLVIFGRGEYFVPPEGYVAVEDVAPPSFDPMTQDLAEGEPEKVGDSWRRKWTITNATPDAVAARLHAKRAGMVVTPRQARQALLQAGKLATVNAALASLPSPQKEAAQIDWEYATVIERNSPLISQLGPALGMTDAQIDDIFALAATL